MYLTERCGFKHLKLPQNQILCMCFSILFNYTVEVLYLEHFCVATSGWYFCNIKVLFLKLECQIIKARVNKVRSKHLYY